MCVAAASTTPPPACSLAWDCWPGEEVLPIGRSGGRDDDDDDDAAAGRRGMAGPSVAVLAVVVGEGTPLVLLPLPCRARASTGARAAGVVAVRRRPGPALVALLLTSGCCSRAPSATSRGGEQPGGQVLAEQPGEGAEGCLGSVCVARGMPPPPSSSAPAKHGATPGGPRLLGPPEKRAFGTIAQWSGSTTIKQSTSRIQAKCRFVRNCPPSSLDLTAWNYGRNSKN